MGSRLSPRQRRKILIFSLLGCHRAQVFLLWPGWGTCTSLALKPLCYSHLPTQLPFLGLWTVLQSWWACGQDPVIGRGLPIVWVVAWPPHCPGRRVDSLPSRSGNLERSAWLWVFSHETEPGYGVHTIPEHPWRAQQRLPTGHLSLVVSSCPGGSSPNTHAPAPKDWAMRGWDRPCQWRARMGKGMSVPCVE